MNIVLWVLQIVLALWNIVGGAYLLHHYRDVGNTWALNALPQPIWFLIIALQVLFGLGLVLPGLLRRSQKLISLSAIGLAVVSLLGIVLYAPYAGAGVLWAFVPAILAACVAYGRMLPDSKPSGLRTSA